MNQSTVYPGVRAKQIGRGCRTVELSTKPKLRLYSECLQCFEKIYQRKTIASTSARTLTQSVRHVSCKDVRNYTESRWPVRRRNVHEIPKRMLTVVGLSAEASQKYRIQRKS